MDEALVLPSVGMDDEAVGFEANKVEAKILDTIEQKPADANVKLKKEEKDSNRRKRSRSQSKEKKRKDKSSKRKDEKGVKKHKKAYRIEDMYDI